MLSAKEQKEVPRPTKHLVISHCYEDLKWLKKVKIPYTIYSKGKTAPQEAIKLPNIGREAHTYLTHVISQYPNFPDITYFTQANPFDHSPDILARLNLPYWDTTTLTGMYRAGYHDHMLWAQRPATHYGYNTTLFKCDHHGRPYGHFTCKIKKPLVWTWFQLFTTKMPKKTEMLWSHAAMFAVPKQRILDRPLKFYHHALQLVHHPNFHHRKFKPNHKNIGPWIYERLWLYIFGNAQIWQTNPALTTTATSDLSNSSNTTHTTPHSEHAQDTNKPAPP